MSYSIFLKHFGLHASKHPQIIVNTLSNIFTMRLVGNKTHGDLAEVGIAEFIEQYLYNYTCLHVGKDHFRAKGQEEDILITEQATGEEILVSLKAYGEGPLQLSTDKEATMFPFLNGKGENITNATEIKSILKSSIFADLTEMNVMPLIYREDSMECNIMVFDFVKMLEDVTRIVLVPSNHRYNPETNNVEPAKGRKHPIYIFLNKRGEYICEVRYGGAAANALQRGLWTHTEKAVNYFTSITGGWITYKHNQELIKLIRLALNSRPEAHAGANVLLQDDITNNIIPNW